VIRIVLAGSTPATRTRLAAALEERLGLPRGDGFVLPDPPADRAAFDDDLARHGADLDALIHLGGGPDDLLDHYRQAVVEVRTDDVDDVLAALREALVAG